MATGLLYLKDLSILESPARVAEVLRENDRDVVILDQTVFYPQGGGQPYDQGIIKSSSAGFLVEEVRFVEGIVKHIGKFENGILKPGDEVQCIVNKERRLLNSRLHSAGHVVDMAVTALNLGWIPGKGFHFPEGPYVEYSGSLEGKNKEELAKDIEDACNKLIGEGRETKLLFMEKEEMGKVCHFVPEHLPEGKPGRVVMYGDFGVPCGGTHVANISEIKGMTIRGVKEKGGNIRVGYDL